MAECRIFIDKAGHVRYLHDDHVAAFVSEAVGNANMIARASHVDASHNLARARLCELRDRGVTPKPTDWWADMSPVRGPLLGPFVTRTQALEAETAYLYANNIPLPEEATHAVS